MIIRPAVPGALSLAVVSLSLLSLGLLPLKAAEAEGPGKLIAGIGPAGDTVEIVGEFKFTEGPAANRDGLVLFADVPTSKVYRVDAGGKSSLFRENSNHTNGQMFNAAGEIVCCQTGRVAVVSADGKSERVLADQYDGKPFNSPNDLVIDRAGGVYFTDPSFAAVATSKQGVSGVYYIAPDAKVTRLIDDDVTPNGVNLSPDEKTLYVIPTLREEMMSYPITAPGKLGPGRVFCKLAQLEGRNGGGGDGCAVDSRGNLYIASGLGVQVFDPQGKALGVIALAKASNCKFGGPDFKTLYVTAQTKVYAVPMEVAGIRPQGASAK
ncbi:MAG TPA: SMP-30/gluconolactonase/LRE family protein [Pirellulales bacterium]|jgi:gluconolactonase